MGTGRIFALYLAADSLSRAALLFLLRHTDSFQATVNHKVSLYSKYSLGPGQTLKCPASPETEKIHVYCTENETAFTTTVIQ